MRSWSSGILAARTSGVLLVFIFLFFVEISSSLPKDLLPKVLSKHSFARSLPKDLSPKVLSEHSFARKYIEKVVPKSALVLAAASWFRPASASADSRPVGRYGDTNDVVRVVNDVKHRRLGNSDIVVSEMGLGTQRWVSCDFNAPNQDSCFQFMDKAILEHGINLIDTAEQYPIPSDSSRPEGSVEEVIGKWINQDKKNRREKVVIATKITGGRVINRKNIIARCDSSLRRLNTDYLDIYQLHWPARYTPQCNWGQSLRYDHDMEKYYTGAASFEEIVLAMSDLVKQGKIRGYGFCNDNPVGLISCSEIAKRLNVPGPVSMQNDFSLIDRRQEENGVAEACSKIHQNVGFMSYNALAGGYLTGKYDNKPAYYDDPSLSSKLQSSKNPRGRHDEPGWSRTLYRYRSSAATSALQEYKKLADEYNISMTELALRWVKERRLVTTTLVGVSSMKQLQENIDIYRSDKDLPPQLLWDIDRVHMKNRLPIFSSDRVGKDWFGEGEIGESIP